MKENNPFAGLECHEPFISWSDESHVWTAGGEKLPPEYIVSDPDFDTAVMMFRDKLGG